jgi:hypothetical protein
MDLLEQKIRNELHEPAEPQKGHLSRFETKLGDRFGNSRSLNWIVPAYAASIAIALAFSALLYFSGNQDAKSELILLLEDEEYAESERYFQQQVEEKIATLKVLEPDISSKLMDIMEFDESLNNLKKDLEETPGDERVVEAVINTYMLKLEALDNMVLILKKQANIL